MEKLITAIVVFLLPGILTGLLAKRKNRNPWGWGVAGAMSSLVALLFLAFMPYLCVKCSQSLTNKQNKNKQCPACDTYEST